MHRFTAQVRLRPIRVAYLVDPDDMSAVQQAFSVNTCLWGGRFNPVIPYFDKVPIWWTRNIPEVESASQIISGYLDFFEPDFLVESKPGMANEFGFSPERVLGLKDLLAREGDIHSEVTGLNVFELYKDLYRKEYQFARRDKHNIVAVSAEDKTFDGLAACLFGAFPQDKGLGYIEQAFHKVFAPEKVSLNALNLPGLYRSGCTSSLRLGCSKIEIDYRANRFQPYLVIVDAAKPYDLLDYWNLRAITRELLAIPKQWLPELSPLCKQFIAENHKLAVGNRDGTKVETTVLFARSFSAEEIEDLYVKYLTADPPAASIRQDWYPALWRKSPQRSIRQTRPMLTASEESFQCDMSDSNRSIRFDSLDPDFVDKYSNSLRWANVVRLEEWSNDGGSALTFPTEYRNPTVPQFTVGDFPTIPTTEGFVVFPRFAKIGHFWQVTEGSEAHREWLRSKGLKSEISDAGRSTQQIIKTLGLSALGSIANPQVIQFLEELSRNISPSAHHLKVKNAIKNATQNDPWRHRAFETLVARNVLELGLELRCPKCLNWNWYSLKQLDYDLQCLLCLQDFQFPVFDPSLTDKSRWAYRLRGPFVRSNFAAGGYASALAIRFFAEVLGHGRDAGVTWSAGQTLKIPDRGNVEADFMLWYQPKNAFGCDYPSYLVFGEAKSFGKDAFKDEDIDRMKTISESFPGAIIVFATMKDASQLSDDEIKRLSDFSIWGRERLTRGTRAPVVILTGTELFSGFSFSDIWAKSGKPRDLLYHCKTSLPFLADQTQQLHLGLPSYHDWWGTQNRDRQQSAQ